MKQLNGIYNVPLVTIIIMGFFFPRIPALAAKVAMGLGIVSYITINYLVKFDFHFLYVLACTFCINVVVMLVIGVIKPRAMPFKFHDAFAVDMKPWKKRQTCLCRYPDCDDRRLCRARTVRRVQHAMADHSLLLNYGGSDDVFDVQQLADAA